MNTTWDAEKYGSDFSYVPEYGRELIGLIDAGKGASVLDLGCGNGTLTKELKDSGYNVQGIDQSDELLSVASENCPGIRFHKGDASFFSLEEPVDVEELTKDLTLQKLGQIFTQVMQRQEGRVDPIRSRFGTIEREQISLDDRIVEVRDIVLREKKTSFRRLLSGQHSKLDVIVTFLSVLELMKSGLITTYQENTFDDIIITAKDVEQTGE